MSWTSSCREESRWSASLSSPSLSWSWGTQAQTAIWCTVKVSLPRMVWCFSHAACTCATSTCQGPMNEGTVKHCSAAKSYRRTRCTLYENTIHIITVCCIIMCILYVYDFSMYEPQLVTSQRESARSCHVSLRVSVRGCYHPLADARTLRWISSSRFGLAAVASSLSDRSPILQELDAVPQFKGTSHTTPQPQHALTAASFAGGRSKSSVGFSRQIRLSDIPNVSKRCNMYSEQTVAE